MHSLSAKEYKNAFVHHFPGDTSGDPRPRQTPAVLYSLVRPTPVKGPHLVSWSADLAAELGISYPETSDIQILSGNKVTSSMQPYAACYAGHQFGHWAGQLGDGRAITLGEWVTNPGQSWELQLKGAGRTPYSRRADGRAVLRSSVREYLMSEAMHYLGVPTTRALSLVTTGEQVMRDMFYNGNPEFEPGAIVMRVAPSFLRFGNYELLAARQETDNLRNLINWTIKNFYPHLPEKENILLWFKEVTEKTALLMVEWQRVGFVHGVMNTDNMSILGLTIDYGPFSFLDNYDPDFTPNTTDLPGRRYAFGQQPSIAYWNLSCLASTLAPLLPDIKELINILEKYEDFFSEQYQIMMGKKLGLDKVYPDDISLLMKAEEVLTNLNLDYTIFFQLLMELPIGINDSKIVPFFYSAIYQQLTEKQEAELKDFITRYLIRIQKNQIQPQDRITSMRKVNPRFILRNYLLHQAIEELSQGETGLFNKLKEALKKPYEKDWDEFMEKRPDWAGQKAGCSMLSCSS